MGCRKSVLVVALAWVVSCASDVPIGAVDDPGEARDSALETGHLKSDADVKLVSDASTDRSVEADTSYEAAVDAPLDATMRDALSNDSGLDASSAVAPGGAALSVETLAYDMFGVPFRNDGRFKDNVQIGAAPWGKHESFARGLPASWDWYHGARFGETPPWSDFMIPWGQLFASASGNNVWNVRLQVRNVYFFYMNSSGTWKEVLPNVSRDTPMSGAFWDDTFTAVPTPDSQKGLRAEGPGQGWSVRLAPMGEDFDRMTWHWFYNAGFYPRPAVPAGTQAVLSACQMGLIQDTESVPLERANFVASFGADHWPSKEGGRPPGKQITPFYQPRMKRVTAQWQWFTGHATTQWFNGSTPQAAVMGPSFIKNNPPPIIGAK